MAIRILWITYYGLRESLLEASLAFEHECGIPVETTDYPLLEKIETEESHRAVASDLTTVISDRVPDIILWWSVQLKPYYLNRVVRSFPGITHIFFNWDDPYVWEVPLSAIAAKASAFDVVLTSSRSCVSRYEDRGVPMVKYVLPGYSPRIHRTIEEPITWICDVSFCCTNLYENVEGQRINRKKLLDEIAERSNGNNSFVFHIYGPEKLRESYPLHYRRYVSYAETQEIFSRSKVNLCTHVCLDDGYLNERVSLILGSGGFLWTDTTANVLTGDLHCTVIDVGRPVDQLVELLKPESDSFRQEVARNGHLFAQQNLQWENWATTLVHCLESEVKELI